MMEKELLKKIAIKLEWDFDRTKQIFNDFLQDKGAFRISGITSKDYLRFLQLCANSENPLERHTNLTTYFLNKLHKNPSKTISNIVIDEICTTTHVIFDLKDMCRDNYIKVNLPIADPQHIFFNEHIQITYLETGETLEVGQAIDETKQKFIETLVRNHFKDNIQSKSEDLEEILVESTPPVIIKNLIIDCISHIGFRVFEIKYFVDYIKHVSLISPYDFTLERIAHSLHKKYLDRKKIIDEKYWFYYCLVEHLRDKGFGLRASFRKAEELVDVKKATVARRYFDKKKEAIESGLTVSDVILAYRFRKRLDDLI